MTRAAHLRHRKLLSRFFITLVVLTSWLVLSNHCALALFQETPQQNEAHSCHAETVEVPATGGETQPPALECCYSLQVAVPDAAKPLLPLADADAFALLPLVWVLITGTPADANADAGTFTAPSPPERLLSFPELVLQRCLPSLAPPLA